MLSHNLLAHNNLLTYNCWRGRRDTWRHPPWFYLAGVVHGDIDLHFVRQAWYVWHWAGSGGALGPEWPGWPPRLLAWQAWCSAIATLVLRGRRDTWWHRSSFCMVGVVRMTLGWLRWCVWAGVAGVAAAAVGVAGVAGVVLCDSHLGFTWQAWYLVTSIFILCGRHGTYEIGLAPVAGLGRSGRGDFTLFGRYGTYGIGLAPVASVGRSGRGGRRGCCRGRYGTLRRGMYGIGLAPVARLGLAWQVWHFATSTFVLCGRHGTWRHRPLLWMTGMVYMAAVAHMALGWLRWRALAGMAAAAVGMAGMALWNTHLAFTQQTWYLVILTFTLWGRYGTYGIGLALAACVGRSGRGGRRDCWRDNYSYGCWCGRRGRRGRHGIWRYLLSFYITNKVLNIIDLHFAHP